MWKHWAMGLPLTAARRFVATFFVLSTAALLWLTATSEAASTQRINLGGGSIAAPAGSWKAIGVPRGDILVDLFDASGNLRQTYGGRYERNFRPTQMETSGMRPQGMPSRQAILVGATGAKIRKVKIYIRGGGTKVVRTVASAPDWGVRNRLFAVVFNVRAAFRNQLIAATKVEALNFGNY
jgi:hypothetical protein